MKKKKKILTAMNAEKVQFLSSDLLRNDLRNCRLYMQHCSRKEIQKDKLNPPLKIWKTDDDRRILQKGK